MTAAAPLYARDMVLSLENDVPKPLAVTVEGGRRVATFATEADAVAWLAIKGFSVGRMQAGSPRGILHGDFEIMKWRNLRPVDRAMLHGMLISGRNAIRASVAIYAGAPAEAKAAFEGAA